MDDTRSEVGPEGCPDEENDAQHSHSEEKDGDLMSKGQLSLRLNPSLKSYHVSLRTVIPIEERSHDVDGQAQDKCHPTPGHQHQRALPDK